MYVCRLSSDAMIKDHSLKYFYIAQEALNTIKPANIATVRKLGKPPHLIMRVMDATMILFRTKLPLISPDPTVPCPGHPPE